MNLFLFRTLALLLAGDFLFTGSLRAASVTVSTTTDEVNGNTTSIANLIATPGGAGISLREAIIAANNTAGADIITLPAGTYTLTRVGNDSTSQNGDLDINGSLTINGAGSGTTFVQGASDAAFTGSIGDKVIGINQDGIFLGLTVSISGVTIRYGRNTIPTSDPTFAYTGAGVDVFLTGVGNSITFSDCVIANNEHVTSYGGGVNIDSGTSGLPGDPPPGTMNRGTVTFISCTITNNRTLAASTATGGGLNLFSDIHDVFLNNCIIANNRAATNSTTANGGGLNVRHTFGGTVTLNNCIITNNTAGGNGGGILTAFVQTLNITGGSISGNTAGSGGGLACGSNMGSPTTLNNVTIMGNNASGAGGALHVSGGGTVTANYCRIVNNTAPAGRAVSQTAGTASVANNWWGTNVPAALMSGTVGFTPWLQLTHTASPNQIFVPNSTTLTASFLTNSAGTFIPAANLSTLIGLPITFNNAVRGTLSGAQAAIQSSSTATATFTANAAGAGSANATVDNQTSTASITIPTGVSSINRVHTTPTNLASVQWTVTFTNPVSGVAAVNFSLVNGGLGGTPAITSVTPVGGAPATLWIVTASTGSGSGTLGLNMINGTGVSAAIVNLPFTGQVYTIDLVAPLVNCSTDIVVNAQGYCPPTVNYSVSVSDNLALAITTTNPPSGSVFPIGTNTVTLGARDTAGNTNSCAFKVIVLPGASPQLRIARNSTNIIVSWTNLFPCYRLQTTPLLSTNGWSFAPGPFTTNAGQIFVTNSAAISNRFYRLSL